MKESILVVIIFTVLVGALVLVILASITANEKTECREWQEQAAKFEGFYLTNWQAEQCQAHSIIINAPVK